MQRLGVGLWGGMSVNELIDVVKLADSRGYESAYIIESFADAFCFLSACARETENIILGTGVATVFTRNPTTIAIAAATVDSISEGRFRLGLGVGHREIHRMRDDVEVQRPSPFADPLGRLRETTELVRAIMKGAHAGELVRFEGEVFRVRDYEPWLSPHRDNIEIFYGAFSRSTFELAGEIADGIAPIFVPLEFVPTMKESVARGAERVGRDPAEIDLGCYLPTAVSDDAAQAKLAAKYDVATHMSSYAYYRNYFVRRGMGEVVDEVVEKVRSEDMGAAADAVPDEMVDAVAVYGTVEDCRRKIDVYREAGISLPIIFPLHPEFRGYLPDPASRAGVFNTIDVLGPG